MGKNVLIIGATGFIGKNVVEDLLLYDYKIIVLVRNQ
jgi:uncharacterized protein YbjT (DUF2867 family)